jgi:hypothetical protein
MSLKFIHTQYRNNLEKKTSTDRDPLFNYVVLLFKLVALICDGRRSIRSAKYETPIYNKNNTLKYLIGSVHLQQ